MMPARYIVAPAGTIEYADISGNYMRRPSERMPSRLVRGQNR
jgi:hypothetical protein